MEFANLDGTRMQEGFRTFLADTLLMCVRSNSSPEMEGTGLTTF